MEKKERILSLIERGLAEERALFSWLTAEERSAHGTIDGWAPKDVISHLADWKIRLAENVARVARGESPIDYNNYLELNDQAFLEHQDDSWERVWARNEQGCRQLAEQVRLRSEAELAQSDFFPGGQPLWRRLVGTAYLHTEMHLVPIYLTRGDRAFVLEMQEEAARRLADLDESESWQGLVQYNLACQYALFGDKERALAGLGKALALAPDLRDYSRQDSDLESLRQEPGYLALYPDCGGTEVT
jgi:tetratricopeptide (TPR) repeat protein